MNKYKLHQWSALLFTLVIFTSCGRKDFPGNNADMQDEYTNTTVTGTVYLPVASISVSDDLAKTNKEGEMYFDNADGYRYWKSSDGKYYLDAKYEYGTKPDKKTADKAAKKEAKKHLRKTGENDFVAQ